MAINRMAASNPKPKKKGKKPASPMPATMPTIEQSSNGHGKVTTFATPIGVSTELGRILRPQAAYRWILPYVAAITPTYIENVMRGALAGNHVQQWELFDLMLDTWPELAAIQQELVYGINRKKLIFEAFHEEDEQPTPTALERMKLVSGALRNMNPNAAADENDLEGSVTDILDGWFRGVTVSEIDWQMVDLGKGVGQVIGPRCTFWVHPVCYGFSSDGVLGLRNPAGQNYKPAGFSAPFVTTSPGTDLHEFPANKFLIGIHKAKSGTALGGAMLRPLAWWWCAANFSADWLMNLAQVFGLPFRWANYDPNAPQATVDAICNMLQNMGSAGWAAFPAGTTMELKEPGRTGSDHSPQGELLDRADRYARTLILGQTMTGGAGTTGKGGGQAFGTIEKDVKEDRVDAAARYAAGVLNQQLINFCLLLNYGDTDEAPQARFLEEEEAEIESAQRDDILVGLGLPMGVKFLQKKYGVPEPAEGEETVSGMSTGASAAADAKNEALAQGGGDGGPASAMPATTKKKKGAIKAKDDGLDYYLGDLNAQFLAAFDGDLTPFRTALEITLGGKTEREQRMRLVALQPHLPLLLKDFIKHGTSPIVMAKIVAKAFRKSYTGAEEARQT